MAVGLDGSSKDHGCACHPSLRTSLSNRSLQQQAQGKEYVSHIPLASKFQGLWPSCNASRRLMIGSQKTPEAGLFVSAHFGSSATLWSLFWKMMGTRSLELSPTSCSRFTKDYDTDGRTGFTWASGKSPYREFHHASQIA